MAGSGQLPEGGTKTLVLSALYAKPVQSLAEALEGPSNNKVFFTWHKLFVAFYPYFTYDVGADGHEYSTRH